MNKCLFDPLSKAYNMSSAYFVVQQTLNGISYLDFEDPAFLEAYIRAIQCSLYGKYTTLPVGINITSVVPLSRGDSSAANANAPGVSVIFKVQFYFSLSADRSVASANAELNAYYNELTHQFAASIISGTFTAVFAQYCLAGNSTVTAQPVFVSPVTFGPYLISWSGPTYNTVPPAPSPGSSSSNSQVFSSLSLSTLYIGIIVTLVLVALVCIGLLVYSYCLYRSHHEAFDSWAQNKATQLHFGVENMRLSYYDIYRRPDVLDSTSNPALGTNRNMLFNMQSGPGAAAAQKTLSWSPSKEASSYGAKINEVYDARNKPNENIVYTSTLTDALARASPRVNSSQTNTPRLAENYSIELRADSPRTSYLPPQTWDREDERYLSSNVMFQHQQQQQHQQQHQQHQQQHQQQNFIPSTVTMFEPVDEFRQIRSADQRLQPQPSVSSSSPERRRQEYENLREEFEDYPEYYRNFTNR